MTARKALAVLPALLTCALGGIAGADPAMAASTSQAVSGTTLNSIALTVGGPAAFTTNFEPGGTATSAGGSLTAIDTNPSWTLQAQDQGTGAGKMTAAATGCTGSAATLPNALTLTVSSALGGVSSAGAVTLSGINQTVASATNQLLSGAALTTAYGVTIPSTTTMLAGCVYSLTTTYTLQ